MLIETTTDLEFEFSLKPSIFSEFSHVLVDFTGQAVLCDDAAGEKVVANLTGHRLDLAGARRSFRDLQQLFDAISPEISDLGSHIIRDNECYTECCSQDETESTPCAGLVYVDELVVDRDYRHRNIGSEMLKRMSEIVDMNMTLVALKAYPIADDEDSGNDRETQKKAIKAFYRKLGFRPSGEDYMVKDARDCYAQRVRAG